MKTCRIMLAPLVFASVLVSHAQSEVRSVFEFDGISYEVIGESAVKVADRIDQKFDLEYAGKIVLPAVAEHDGKSYDVREIGMDAFSGCDKVTAIVLPSGVEKIANGAFSFCGSLESVQIPGSLKEIGSYAFNGCRSLGSLDLGDAELVNIPMGLCHGCEGVVSIGLPDGVEEIAREAFSGCASLKNIELPTSLRTVGNSAFENCSSLESVEFGREVREIGSLAFSGCGKLSSFLLPESVSAIHSYAFKGCGSIESLTIPAGCHAVMDEAFSGTSLKYLSFCGTELPTLSLERSFGDQDWDNMTVAIMSPDRVPVSGLPYIEAFPQVFEGKCRLNVEVHSTDPAGLLCMGGLSVSGAGNGALLENGMSVYAVKGSEIGIHALSVTSVAGFKLYLDDVSLEATDANDMVSVIVTVPENDGEIKVDMVPSGIDAVSAPCNGVSGCWSLDGVYMGECDNESVSMLPSGIYVIRKDGEVSKVVVR